MKIQLKSVVIALAAFAISGMAYAVPAYVQAPLGAYFSKISAVQLLKESRNLVVPASLSAKKAQGNVTYSLAVPNTGIIFLSSNKQSYMLMANGIASLNVVSNPPNASLVCTVQFMPNTLPGLTDATITSNPKDLCGLSPNGNIVILSPLNKRS